MSRIFLLLALILGVNGTAVDKVFKEVKSNDDLTAFLGLTYRIENDQL